MILCYSFSSSTRRLYSFPRRQRDRTSKCAQEDKNISNSLSTNLKRHYTQIDSSVVENSSWHNMPQFFNSVRTWKLCLLITRGRELGYRKLIWYIYTFRWFVLKMLRAPLRQCLWTRKRQAGTETDYPSIHTLTLTQAENVNFFQTIWLLINISLT